MAVFTFAIKWGISQHGMILNKEIMSKCFWRQGFFLPADLLSFFLFLPEHIHWLPALLVKIMAKKKDLQRTPDLKSPETFHPFANS